MKWTNNVRNGQAASSFVHAGPRFVHRPVKCLVCRILSLKFAAVSEFNYHDYDDAFFSLMDTVGIRHLERYVSTVGRAKSDIDRFLDARGYIDNDYLYEHLGTRYLRAQDYARAVDALSKVSPAYQYRTNLLPCNSLTMTSRLCSLSALVSSLMYALAVSIVFFTPKRAFTSSMETRRPTVLVELVLESVL